MITLEMHDSDRTQSPTASRPCAKSHQPNSAAISATKPTQSHLSARVQLPNIEMMLVVPVRTNWDEDPHHEAHHP